jgi:predicted transcriptional regulator
MTKPIPVQTYRLDQTGLMRLFGELEARIMDIIWDLSEGTIQDVCDRLGEVNYLTITTVMNRLVYKNVLRRWRVGKAYYYAPLQRREEFIRDVSQQVVHSLIKDFGLLATNEFVDALEELPAEELAKLEQAIQQARRKADTHG